MTAVGLRVLSRHLTFISCNFWGRVPGILVFRGYFDKLDLRMKKWDERFLKEKYVNTSYYYWDTPDGQDCFKKIWFTTKHGVGLGLVMSLYDISMLSHPKGYFQGLSRLVHFTAPAAAVGLAFGALTCTLTTLRNKDDQYNFLISGFAAGTIWGAARQNVGVGVRAGVFLSVLAFLTKVGHMEGWQIIPDGPIGEGHGSFDSYKFDWTLMKDPRDREK